MMCNSQWYERFNTKVNGSNAIGVMCQHTVLMEYIPQELHLYPFTNITPLEKESVHIDNKERYISYTFLSQSFAQHNKI